MRSSRRRRSRGIPPLFLLALLLLARASRAQEVAVPPDAVAPGTAWPASPVDQPTDEDPSRWLKELEVEAGALEADLKLRELDLSHGVKVRLSPYYLRADRIHLSLGKWGVRVVGNGVLTFCPCDAPPIGIGFSGGWAGPPDELIVEDPTLRVFGLPIFWLPYLWLRSPRKVGLTVPDISYRGKDGVFLGQGVHFPVGEVAWGSGLEIGVGVYTRGGYAGSIDLATSRSTTHGRVDWRSPTLGSEEDVPSGVGLALESHGDFGPLGSSSAPTLVFDADVLRGARGIRTTLAVEPVSRPFDRAGALATLGPLGIGFDAVDRRGGPIDRVDYARPYTSLGHAFALGTLGGGAIGASVGPRLLRGRRADAIGDGALELDIGAPIGPLMFSAIVRGDGRAARSGGDETSPGAPLTAGVGEVRLEASLPLAKPLSLERAAGGPPVLHVIEPLLRAAAVAASARGDREALSGFVGAPAILDGNTAIATAGMAAIGARTSIGSMASGIAPGRDPWIGKLSSELTVGAIASASRRDPMGAFDLSWLTRRGDGGGAQLESKGVLTRELGWVALGRAHLDTSRDGVGLELRGAARGELPVMAGWALLGADVAPRLATVTGFALPGSTLGAGASFPLGSSLRLAGDVDLYAPSFAALADKGGARLIDVRSSVRYRHPCGCFRLIVRGGHLVGREGIDVSATFELARIGPEDPRDW